MRLNNEYSPDTYVHIPEASELQKFEDKIAPTLSMVYARTVYDLVPIAHDRPKPAEVHQSHWEALDLARHRLAKVGIRTSPPTPEEIAARGESPMSDDLEIDPR